jgi:hypothetical protein
MPICFVAIPELEKTPSVAVVIKNITLKACCLLGVNPIFDSMNKFSSILPILFLFSTSTMEAQQALPLQRVSVFKNSTCLMAREGKVSVKDGIVRLPIPQEALFGGYWIGATGNSVQSLTFKNDKLEKKETAKELWHYLAGNVGKTVTASLTQKESKSITGKIVSFEKETGVVTIRQDNGKLTIVNAQHIYLLDFENDIATTFLEDSVLRMVLLKPEKPCTEINLQQLSIQAGVNWVPSYLLKIKDEKTARLEMKAVVENYVEDITEAETELVVGAPQLYFGQRRDPVTYDYITADGNARQDYDAQPMQMLSNARRSGALGEAEESAFEGTYATEGEKNSDLYIYKIGKISLPKNSKGSYPVFAAAVEYKHKYEGIIPDKTNFASNRYVEANETTYDVYHSLSLTNTAKMPLTTAPVMVVTEKEQFLAQDLLKYTPVNGAVDVKLSKAIDVVLRNTEEEVQRTDEAKKIRGTTFGKVVIKGSVTVSNFQNKELALSVKKTVTGFVLNQSDKGSVIKSGMNYEHNPNSIINWEVTLPVNGKKVITYEYEVFFRQ